MVSHDRELLDHICTDIIEIDQAALHRYKGNYSNYQQQKQRLLRQQYNNIENTNPMCEKSDAYNRLSKERKNINRVYVTRQNEWAILKRDD